MTAPLRGMAATSLLTLIVEQLQQVRAELDVSARYYLDNADVDLSANVRAALTGVDSTLRVVRALRDEQPVDVDALALDRGVELIAVRSEDVEPELDTCDVCGVIIDGEHWGRSNGELLCDDCYEVERERAERERLREQRDADADAHHERVRAEREDAA